jgi:hypothetical protein
MKLKKSRLHTVITGTIHMSYYTLLAQEEFPEGCTRRPSKNLANLIISCKIKVICSLFCFLFFKRQTILTLKVNYEIASIVLLIHSKPFYFGSYFSDITSIDLKSKKELKK